MNEGAGERHADHAMPFYRVLEDEFDNLHPRARVEEAAKADSAKSSDGPGAWAFTSDQILDPQDIARRLDSPNGKHPSEDIAGTVINGAAKLSDTLHAYLNAGRPFKGDIAAAFTNELVLRLNAMLTNEALRTYDCVAVLPLSPYANDLREREEITGARVYEANRLFLETGFPTQLKRVRDVRLSAAYDRIRVERHAALCLSGGGIRSATFALGVVQGLARANVLLDFHYLSTVSGGGFLGGWLSSWMQHAGPEYVQAELSKRPSAKLDPEAMPIRHLRTYANYLSPRFGLLSVDTWTLIATYLRNVLLNWLVIVPLMAAVLLVPWLSNSVVSSNYDEWLGLGEQRLFGMRLFLVILYGLGALCGVFAVAYVHGTQRAKAEGQSTVQKRMERTQRQFLFQCLAPLVISAILLTTAWKLNWSWDKEQAISEIANVWGFIGAGAALHSAGWALGARFHWWMRRYELVFTALAGAVMGALSFVVARWFMSIDASLYTTFAMPTFLLLLMLGGQIFLGIMSRKMSDDAREWGARFNAWVLIVAVGWALFGGIVLHGSDLIKQGYEWLVAGVGGLAGVLTIAIGTSTKSRAKPSEGSATTKGSTERGDGRKTQIGALTGRLHSVVLALAAPIFAVSIVIGISAFCVWAMGRACLIDIACRSGTGEPAWSLIYPSTIAVMLFLLVMGGLLLGLLIDTNDFSLHAMYRARLIRAYLGASRPPGERRPDPFTGFDDKDDIPMSQLWPASRKGPSATTGEQANVAHGERDTSETLQPMHVVNMALNLVAGENLAWQERKAESFTVTSLHAGSPRVGYRRMSQDKSETGSNEPEAKLYADGQLSLGTAITVSGAAASPNMGYHSSPVVTFLMTLFNARLGAWFGNPGPSGDKTFALSQRKLAIKPIVSELFGLSTDRSDSVYLSDGGHFDNLGLYEMVLRRCRLIVLSDASCDEICSFEDLGNAIRKIRIDLGVPIEFPEGLTIFPRSASANLNARHWAVGKICYSHVDSTGPRTIESDKEIDGVLIYIKPSFYGVKEPQDVYNYAQSSPQFPHEPTSDQFFSESQFESYRALGSYIIEQLCEDPAAKEIISAVKPNRQAAQREFDPLTSPPSSPPAHTYPATAPAPHLIAHSPRQPAAS